MASQRFQHNLMDIQSNMLNFAYMLTSNRDDAHDLLQSTTLKALVNEDKYIGKELSKYIGVPQTTLSDLENDKYEPSLSVAKKIAKYFGKKIDELT